MSEPEKTEKTEMNGKAEGAPPAGKKSKLVPVLAVLAFVLIAGGAAGYWMYAQRPAGEGVDAKEPEAPPPGMVDMEPFVVNLADESGKRFLRVNMKLLTWDKKQALEVKEHPVVAARVRSSILELLSLQYAAPLVTPDGKEELKAAIAERATEAGGHELKVTDVLFVEFVVQ